MFITDALIVAAGKGLRMNSPLPKQYMDLCGRPVLLHTIAVFSSHSSIRRIYLVIPQGDEEYVKEQISVNGFESERIVLVEGGQRRGDSVRFGLERMSQDPPDIVAIHDGVRPFVSHRIITESIAAAIRFSASVPVVPVEDTLRRSGERGFLGNLVDRRNLFRVQTPQVFKYGLILEAHRDAGRRGLSATDDASLAMEYGADVRMIEGEVLNFKITTQSDFTLAKMVALYLKQPA